MDKRTTSIILTVVAVLLCGCPGLASLCAGGLMAAASFTEGATFDIFGRTDSRSALIAGVASVCIGIIFIAIPIIVGFLTLGKKKDAVSNEPLPPTI